MTPPPPHVSAPGVSSKVAKLPLTLSQIDGQLNTHRMAIIEWRRKGEFIEARRVINEYVNPLLDARLKMMPAQERIESTVTRTVVPLAIAP